MTKRIYRFAADEVDGDASMLMLLGGKGANLAEMASMKIPVPPGFTITTDVCKAFESLAPEDEAAFLEDLLDEVSPNVGWLTDKLGYLPLMSVRSGAPVSMPGMMDTILNVGLTSSTAGWWGKRLGERAMLDSYRRLIQMMGSTAYGIDMAKFDFQLASVKKQAGVTQDTELTPTDLTKLIQRYQAVFCETTGTSFPDLISQQLRAAIKAVFRSWMNPRAIEYRKINGIDAAMGTAVTVQAMVFGNTGEDSGTGVLFSRNAATGANEILGEFLPNAQGEDVVAGIRTPLPLSQMQALPNTEHHEAWHNAYEELMVITQRLEHHYRDMMDLEFTVQNGKLWLLQCRVGKRSALAAFKIARQLVDEGLITPQEATQRVTKAQYRLVRRPRIADGFKEPPHVVGKGASPGVAVGKIVFTAEAAVNCKEPCVLVTHETCPDDIAGMHKAQGILTATGGATSHAAVVARGMDKPCVVGCTSLHLEGEEIHVVGKDIAADAGSKVTIDGDTGRAWFGIDVPVEDASDDPDVRQICLWLLERQGFGLQVSWPIGNSCAQTIKLADFWGDDAHLTALLACIETEGLADKVTLDVSPPHCLTQPEDAVLADCFGTCMAMEGWGATLVKDLLLKAGTKAGLVGLTVIGQGLEAGARAALKAAGYGIAETPKTLQDLLHAKSVVVTDQFVNEVVGSQGALTELIHMMNNAGKSVSVLNRAVPLEYAAFAALR